MTYAPKVNASPLICIRVYVFIHIFVVAQNEIEIENVCRVGVRQQQLQQQQHQHLLQQQPDAKQMHSFMHLLLFFRLRALRL